MIQAGKMRDRVTIQKPVGQGDGQGGYYDYLWEDVATVWAMIKTVSASSFADIERFQQNQYRTLNHYLVTIRYGQEIATNMRFLYKTNRVFQIESVVNIDSLNWQVTLYCREEGKIS